MEFPRILSIAAASGRIGYVYLIGAQLRDWRISEKAAQSPAFATKHAQKWIAVLGPEVVVTEKVEASVKKGAKTKLIIAAIARTAEQHPLLCVPIKRQHDFPSKYEEAEELAVRYPDIKDWLPTKRRFFDDEPRNTVLFEALSLAETVLGEPTTTMAVAMG